jgi:hypothetical protein
MFRRVLTGFAFLAVCSACGLNRLAICGAHADSKLATLGL